ncbi:Rv3654c family TadE-like protein [Nonomuraea endophytica]|uniref:Rv3654c family TadE-like protein n=1 Tax=Nonomuraea endophytica TaxID=714136 RepID=UPI0037C8AE4B
MTDNLHQLPRKRTPGDHRRVEPRPEPSSDGRGGPTRDQGSATIWGVALMALLMSVAMALAAVGSVRVARHRVYAAADLSALEAARLALAAPDQACTRAEQVATANAVRLTRCTITDETADVWTSLEITIPGMGKRTLTGRARAGPSWITSEGAGTP